MAGGLLAVELGLRPLTTPLDNTWAPIVAEKGGGEPLEVRRFTEGIAASHFTRSRSRLTGNPPIPGAPTGLILGDSYVEAVQVSDSQTMGAVLERSLRAADRSINVRQYGWSGVGVAQYVLGASKLIRLWDPVWVVVVITASDLGPDLVTGPIRLVRHTDGQWGAVGGWRPAADSIVERTGRLRRIGETALEKSVLLYQLAKRAQEAGLPLLGPRFEGVGATSAQQGGPLQSGRALAAVAALRNAYGDRLRILYLADVGVDGRSPKPPAEEAFLASCAQLGTRCADTRALMTRDRLDSLRLSRGFINSVPGAGHINAVGHTLAAETILRDLLSP